MVLGCVFVERFERRQTSRRSDVVQWNIAGNAVEPAVRQLREYVSFKGTGGGVGNVIDHVPLNGVDAGIET